MKMRIKRKLSYAIAVILLTVLTFGFTMPGTAMAAEGEIELTVHYHRQHYIYNLISYRA